MKKIAIMFLSLLLLFTAGCGSDNSNSAKQNQQNQQKQQKQNQISHDEQEKQHKAAIAEQQRQAKQAAQNVAMQFTTAFFNDDLNSMKGITYCSDESVDTPRQISIMQLCKSRIVGYLGYKMDKQKKKNYQYHWTVALTDYSDSTAHYKFDVSIDGTLYLTVKDITMSKSKDGQWYVDMTSFINQNGSAMDVKDQMRNFE